jgi:hypothetical protein
MRIWMVIETPYEVMKREKLGIKKIWWPMFLVCTGSSPKTTKAHHVNIYIHISLYGFNQGDLVFWVPIADGPHFGTRWLMVFWRLKNVDVCRPIDGLFCPNFLQPFEEGLLPLLA